MKFHGCLRQITFHPKTNIAPIRDSSCEIVCPKQSFFYLFIFMMMMLMQPPVGYDEDHFRQAFWKWFQCYIVMKGFVLFPMC